MNISLNWLKEYVNLSNINPENIKDELTSQTVEVESLKQLKDQYKNIVVAKILTIEKHPQADKLQLATLDDGQSQTLKVVCGAPNIAVGQMVPLAKIGAVMAKGLEIKPTVIRGQESSGMLCAADELGLGLDHSGIMILDESAKIGQSLADYLNFNDVILEIDNKSLSNRPDLWNHYGLARELSVIFDKKLKKYESKKIKIKKSKNQAENIEVEIKVKNLCKKYLALKIDKIKVEESPRWLKNKLQSVGLNPVNNIVDITNYVMLDIGQPLHAFDAENIKKIIVRPAKQGEKLLTLDDQEHTLNEDDLVISSDRQALALAGVIGGKNSQINPATSSIIIESANFDAVSIRKTGQKLALRTESVIRFEKGLDPNLCQLALEKAVEMIKELCPKAVFQNEEVIENFYADEEKTIKLDLSWVEKIIGQKIPEKKIKFILEKLGLSVKNIQAAEENSGETWEMSIPSWRKKDLQIREDLVEEISRIYGYNNIVARMPQDTVYPPDQDPEMELNQKIKEILAFSHKMTEVYNYSFINEDQLLKLGLDSKNHIRLLNPLSSQHTLLKQSLLTNLISNVKSNQAKYESISLFEMDNIFLNIPGDLNKDDKKIDRLPYQEKKLGLILSDGSLENFKHLKNIIFNLILEIAGQQKMDFLPTESIIAWSKEREKCLIILNDKEIGYLAGLSRTSLNKNGLKREVAYAEISLKNLLAALNQSPSRKYQAIPKFPAVNRDLAFVIDQKILYNDISQEIKNFHPLIKEIELFDVYCGQNLDQHKKSLAFHLSYQAADRTLIQAEVEKIQKDLIKHLQDKLGAQIRDF